MKKHEWSFLIGLAVGFLLAKPIRIYNINGNSHATIQLNSRTYGQGNKTGSS
ncbi:hypothetical protein [Ectobacillus ponti]|uniref:Uncharacterized protein n=1 Tax=Ectobacillus ponti TaxID=2961894 RepID=A0AA41X875_9BACI|nr:hypothetical protein [Ectobacillus ponti]MCP8968675.1 hypothetical protein [Ectobacillus ponti]